MPKFTQLDNILESILKKRKTKRPEDMTPEELQQAVQDLGGNAGNIKGPGYGMNDAQLAKRFPEMIQAPQPKRTPFQLDEANRNPMGSDSVMGRLKGEQPTVDLTTQQGLMAYWQSLPPGVEKDQVAMQIQRAFGSQ